MNFSLMKLPLFFLLLSIPRLLQAEPQCGDFLSRIGKKPQDLQFISCKKTKEQQLNALQAIYRVPGSKAVEVEKGLVKNFQMPKLRFVCCGWESSSNSPHPSREGSFRDSERNPYWVRMHSEETIAHKRANWSKISYFIVTVTLPLEEP